MANVYVRLGAIEVRTSAGGEAWNEEPLDPTSLTGTTRATYGCATSRTVGTDSNIDTETTLENFRCMFFVVLVPY